MAHRNVPLVRASLALARAGCGTAFAQKGTQRVIPGRGNGIGAVKQRDCFGVQRADRLRAADHGVGHDREIGAVPAGGDRRLGLERVLEAKRMPDLVQQDTEAVGSRPCQIGRGGEAAGVGGLVTPEDPADLENALMRLLNEPERRREMGRKGSQIARQDFRWESRVDAIEQLLTGLA